MTRFALTLILSIFIVGCASINKYEEPKVGQLATITIRTTANTFVNLRVIRYTGDDVLDTKGEELYMLNSKTIGYDNINHISKAIAAGEEFRFSIMSGFQRMAGITKAVSYACKAHVGFIPKKNVKYEAIHSASEDNSCSIKIFQVMSDGSRSEEITAKTYKSCFDPSIARGFDDCKAGFNFRQ